MPTHTPDEIIAALRAEGIDCQPHELGLCHCGCGERTKLATRNDPRFGWTKGQPRRFLAGHQGRTSAIEYVEEDRGHATPCWTWQRAKYAGGYGLARKAGGSRLAHKVYYERAHGPVSDGYQLDHLCRNRDCVNPDHLEPVPSAINTRRGDKTKLTQAQVDAIRRSPAGSSTPLARTYGVSVRHIQMIRNRQRWHDVEQAA